MSGSGRRRKSNNTVHREDEREEVIWVKFNKEVRQKGSEEEAGRIRGGQGEEEEEDRPSRMRKPQWDFYFVRSDKIHQNLRAHENEGYDLLGPYGIGRFMCSPSIHPDKSAELLEEYKTAWGNRDDGGLLLLKVKTLKKRRGIPRGNGLGDLVIRGTDWPTGGRGPDEGAEKDVKFEGNLEIVLRRMVRPGDLLLILHARKGHSDNTFRVGGIPTDVEEEEEVSNKVFLFRPGDDQSIPKPGEEDPYSVVDQLDFALEGWDIGMNGQGALHIREVSSRTQRTARATVDVEVATASSSTTTTSASRRTTEREQEVEETRPSRPQGSGTYSSRVPEGRSSPSSAPKKPNPISKGGKATEKTKRTVHFNLETEASNQNQQGNNNKRGRRSPSPSSTPEPEFRVPEVPPYRRTYLGKSPPQKKQKKDKDKTAKPTSTTTDETSASTTTSTPPPPPPSGGSQSQEQLNSGDLGQLESQELIIGGRNQQQEEQGSSNNSQEENRKRLENQNQEEEDHEMIEIEEDNHNQVEEEENGVENSINHEVQEDGQRLEIEVESGTSSKKAALETTSIGGSPDLFESSDPLRTDFPSGDRNRDPLPPLITLEEELEELLGMNGEEEEDGSRSNNGNPPPPASDNFLIPPPPGDEDEDMDIFEDAKSTISSTDSNTDPLATTKPSTSTKPKPRHSHCSQPVYSEHNPQFLQNPFAEQNKLSTAAKSIRSGSSSSKKVPPEPEQNGTTSNGVSGNTEPDQVNSDANANMNVENGDRVGLGSQQSQQSCYVNLERVVILQQFGSEFLH